VLEAQEVNDEVGLLTDEEPDKTGTELVASIEVGAEPPDDKTELVTCCNVETLDDTVAELTVEVGMVPRECEDPRDGTTTTGGAPLDAA
jgi:hypothetical protein